MEDDFRGLCLIIAIFCFAGIVSHFFMPVTTFNFTRIIVLDVLMVIFWIASAEPRRD